MTIRIPAIAALAALLAASAAQAQSTLADLTAAGATKLGAADVKALYAGSNVTGPTLTGGSLSIDYKSNGTFSGTFTTPAGKGGGRFGKWSVDDAGRFCADASNQSFGASSSTDCSSIYKLGDEYFAVVESDANSTRRAVKRTYRK